ncbi:hypothetical protein PR202_gb12417 [Eleusine coracana subsp. coracana]|uniref:Uncharacterized protein n=1 Tax=Eleusine coracana subsp. coracana TaxID=191504 RepID=A0AAV5EPJ1_ELECO|nr:hypothetical protein PR202_gb12417 [Eleusine coracana subsp. coracana]
MEAVDGDAEHFVLLVSWMALRGGRRCGGRPRSGGRMDILDQALLRLGRINRKIEFSNPNEDFRCDILRIHSRKMKLAHGIDLKKIAEKMNDASGAS